MKKLLIAEIAKRDLAGARCLALNTKLKALEERCDGLANIITDRRAALRAAAGAQAAGDVADVEGAREALKQAEIEADHAAIELAGIGDVVEAAKADLDRCERAVANAGAALAIMRCGVLERSVGEAADALRIARTEHRELGMLARRLASQAAGGARDPVPSEGPFHNQIKERIAIDPASLRSLNISNLLADEAGAD